MFCFHSIFLLFVFGFNYLVSIDITLQQAQEIVSKVITPLFVGFHYIMDDTSYSTHPSDLEKTGHRLDNLTKIGIVPADFQFKINGGQYGCTKHQVIKLCNLVPIYTYFDHYINNTYIEDQAHLHQRTDDPHRAVSTVAKLIGYFSSKNGSCGAVHSITRIRLSKKTEPILQNRVDVRIYHEPDTKPYRDQKINNPGLYDSIFRPFNFGWKMGNVNTRAGLMRYNELNNNLTIDGKPVDRTYHCAGDSFGVITLEDYKDDMPLVGDELSLLNGQQVAGTTTPKVDEVVDC
uniref:DDE_5 domain-containing protein n=1 Tax=Strongyloides papillosus TaxID=174720 RepID=A0A0N5BTS2_STREA